MALGLSACGGTSESDQAREDVCEARADISKQVDSLREMTSTTVTVDAVRRSVAAIRADLQQIKDARPDLKEQTRNDLAAASDAFAAQVRELGATVLRSTSVQEAQTQLQAAITQLGESYKTTLGEFDCE